MKTIVERIENAPYIETTNREDLGPCHIFTGQTTEKGYGRIKYMGRWVRVHRAVLEMKLGRELGEGMVCMHMCDTPSCIRPEHLAEGTVADNVRDAASKGRKSTQRGKTCPRIPNAAYALLEALAAQGESKAAISRATGISHQQVCNILNGRTPLPKAYLKSRHDLAA